jgi:alkanesulfonate monooxygenase SsuD/methylene tetrahydromethanopterin reductase-like flavin-dependent oxidoreductase (luciferase family)
VTYRGGYYVIEGARLQPRPHQQQPHQPYVPLLVGGGGERTTLRLVAQYADASSIVATAAGGGVLTKEDLRHKYAVLHEHCGAWGRPTNSVLRTCHFFPVLLADSAPKLAVKRERLPDALLAMAGGAAVIGTPAQAVERLQPLVAAGCRYFTMAVSDPDTLRLLSEQVVPAVAAAP